MNYSIGYYLLVRFSSQSLFELVFFQYYSFMQIKVDNNYQNIDFFYVL